MSIQPVTQAQLFGRLPPEYPRSLLPDIQARVVAGQRTLVVLDDDPTGTQTVYDLPVLTEWSSPALQHELARGAPIFYILTNSRSLPLLEAQALNAAVARNLLAASRAAGRDFAVVSRSDSTLRGHYPGEVDALTAALGQSVDATLIIPFFLEGGRHTVDDVHYVAEGDRMVPAGDTPFARDAVFGYQSSNLRDWVAEKTGGRVRAEQVAAISIQDLRIGGPTAVQEKLAALRDGRVCIVNCAGMRDMEVFVCGLLDAEAAGKRFVYRTAASFVQVRAGLASRPTLGRADLRLPASGGGLFVVGSYVPRTTSQVAALLEQTHIDRVEVDVAALLDAGRRQGEVTRAAAAVDDALVHARDVVVYTSRTLVTGADAAANLAIGQQVSASLIAVVHGLQQTPRYVVAKGGITASDVATQGLGIRRAQVLGQVLPGVPVWRTGPESRYPGLVYVVFPGNVGDANALVDVQRKLRPD